MFGLSTLGIIHTLISLVAVVAGIMALVREQRINPGNTTGKVYIWATVLTCVTGFGIFAHGGFGKPHALGIITLVVLGVAALAGSSRLFGKAAVYVETICYSLTFFFHMVPGITESTTRLPLGNPIFSSPDAEGLQQITGVAFLLFLIGVVLQVRRLRADKSWVPGRAVA
ncbi:hypothetical protein [Undibacterium sp.]|uniref:hypothetical protein n=1 Tax=Undibacterium sp. TaxID=1914977 RepID=UPI00374D70E1